MGTLCLDVVDSSSRVSQVSSFTCLPFLLASHPSCRSLLHLLQVMEDGRLTDSGGRTVSFKNTLIVLTTNIGSQVIAKGGGGVGFQLPNPDGSDAAAGRLRSLVLEELKAYFRPELLNRLDEVVVFGRLGRPELAQIAGLELAKTEARAAERGVALRLGPGVMDRIIEEGYSEEMGARELRRAVTRCVDDPLADALLSGRVAPGGTALLRLPAGGAAGAALEVVDAAEAEAEASVVMLEYSQA